MFGDGINDAPTLALADVSFAFSNATDLARASSDFVMLNKGYTGLPEAFELMYATRRVILQNLLWALLYNLSAIPLAAAGLVPPWAAAIGMSVSSLIVVLNAIRLKRKIPMKLQINAESYRASASQTSELSHAPFRP